MSSLFVTSSSGTQYRGTTTASGSAFSSAVIARALPLSRACAATPSKVAKRWSYWWNSLASYSGKYRLPSRVNTLPRSSQPSSTNSSSVQNKPESLDISNIRWNEIPHGFTSGCPPCFSLQKTPARRYILRAISMSLRVRKMGQVRVFGLNSAKSSADSVNLRSASTSCSAWCRKNANSASGQGRSAPLSVSRQNLIRLSMPGKTFPRFSKSYRLTSRFPVTAWSKNALVELSVAMPVGTIRPARPFGPTRCRNVSAKTA